MSEERRLVTVLFSDVTGSTALGEALDPEDMRALLSRYFAIAREVVADHGGTIEKFIGDAVMAVFGLPIAHDDDAARAAAAALAVRRRVRADPVLGDRLPIRLGIATGEVVASTDEDAGDFLITGDAVNVAARLQQGAGDWEILATVRTARAAGDGFDFEAPIAVEAKGKGAPIEARLLRGVAETRPHLRTPFLGRDADVEQLQLTTRRAFRERRPYLVTVTAPAGIGKTRLLEEFLGELPDLAPGSRVLMAQCLPYGQQLTYLPLLALLRSLLGLPADVEPEQLRGAATGWLAAAGDPAPARSAELLAATFGATEGERIDRSELFAAWRNVVELAARQQPLVVVIEDLHWSSDSLLDLIEVVLQPRGDAPLLMVVLARPELLDRRPTWGGGRRNYVSIALEPLDDLAIAALSEFLLKGPPEVVVDAIVARAEGNPFYAGELARTVSERSGALADPSEAAAIVSGLPDTVHATVLARLDLLPPGPRRVLQLGSVLGRSFSGEGVAALETDSTVLDPALEHLLDHDLVRREVGGEYTFRHILIREVAYQTLPRAERARLHALAGRWLIGRGSGHEDELAELVAFHLREAVVLGTAAGSVPDPAILDEAVTWLRRAADAASAGAAYEESARHLRAAIEIAPRDHLPELWADLGDIFGGGRAAVDSYSTAVRLGRELGRSPDFILRALAGRLMVLGRWPASVGGQATQEELEALADEVREARRSATDRGTIGYSFVAESFVPFGAVTGGVGELSEQLMTSALAAADEAVAIARELDDATMLSAALDALGGLLSPGDAATGLRIVKQRVEIESRLPLYERLDVYNVLAWMHAFLGDLDESLEASDRMLRDLAPNQAQALALSLSAWKVWALAKLGRWDEVSGAAERSNRLWEDVGRISAGFALNGFVAALAVGRARGDDRLADRARAILTEIVEQFPPGQIFRRLAAFAEPDTEALVREVVLDWEPYAARFHLVELAIATCVDRGRTIPLEVLDRLVTEGRERHHRLVLAQALRARGVQAGTPADLAEAMELFRGFGARPDLARAQIELGELTGDAALRASGIAILEDLGDLDQLGRVSAAAR